jgi:hypothetical protein
VLKVEENNEPKTCCSPSKKEGKGFWQGFFYGLVPHTGCIAFIAFTILGVTTATAFFRPLLMNRYFFHALIILSIVLATISAAVYLKKRNMLSVDGIRQKKKYLGVLYGTSVGVNLLLFIVIFPLTANMTGAAIAVDGMPQITLKVDIPCPGHAPLISDSLREVQGVKSVKYRFPDYFDVAYDSYETNADEMLSIDVFSPYPAVVVGQTQVPAEEVQQESYAPRGCSRCGGCSGACGGTCTV